MNFSLSKTIFILGISICTLSFFACNRGHEEGGGHDHGENAQQGESAEENHEGESSAIVSLTPEQIKAVEITLGDIENKNLTAVIKVNGSLRVPNRNSANATTLYGGVIKTLNVELGDHVRKGQVIATIENPQFIQMQEEYLTIGSQIILAEQEFERQRELNEGNAGAKRNLQDATAKINTLRTRKASLQQQIRMMGLDPHTISNSNLRNALMILSPINGTVSNVLARIGSYADVSSPVAEIVDNSQLHLDLQVFEQDLPKIKTGQLISFTITNNPSVNYSARVYNIGSSFQDASKTIAVHSTIQGDKKGLIDGMNITALVDIENVLMPAVPDGAIVEADGNFYIFVQTDKVPAEHNEGSREPVKGDTHTHRNEQAYTRKPGEKHDHTAENGNLSFEKIEVAKGVSYMGYTAVTPVKELPAHAKVVTKGAFFINAKMSDTEGHAHDH